MHVKAYDTVAHCCAAHVVSPGYFSKLASRVLFGSSQADTTNFALTDHHVFL